MKTKKMLPAIALTLVAGGSLFAAANDDMQNRSLESRVTALEKRQAMVNPPGNPGPADGVGLFVSADALYWRANENGLGYVIKDKENLALNSINEGKVSNPHNQYRWGFRVGLGYNMAHDNSWDIYANWTHFNHRSRSNTHADEGEALFSTFRTAWLSNADLAPNANPRDASARWKLRFNQIDLELGREFFVSKWLTLRPHIGLRAASIKQRYDVSYQNFVQSVNNSEVEMKNNFRGMGLRAGFDTQWGLGCGWSIYGNAAISLMYGKVRVTKEDEVEDTVFFSTEVTNRYHIDRAATDLELGLRYDHIFCNDNFHFGIQVGWEQHIYFGQNQLMQFTANSPDLQIGQFFSNQGDLTFSGWTAQVRFDF